MFKTADSTITHQTHYRDHKSALNANRVKIEIETGELGLFQKGLQILSSININEVGARFALIGVEAELSGKQQILPFSLVELKENLILPDSFYKNISVKSSIAGLVCGLAAGFYFGNTLFYGMLGVPLGSAAGYILSLPAVKLIRAVDEASFIKDVSILERFAANDLADRDARLARDVLGRIKDRALFEKYMQGLGEESRALIQN
ncbi:MAG: hypothetical protein AABZ57_03105 [Candidatus Margulisiibacteriota bacterium]